MILEHDVEAFLLGAATLDRVEAARAARAVLFDGEHTRDDQVRKRRGFRGRWRRWLLLLLPAEWGRRRKWRQRPKQEDGGKKVPAAHGLVSACTGLSHRQTKGECDKCEVLTEMCSFSRHSQGCQL